MMQKLTLRLPWRKGPAALLLPWVLRQREAVAASRLRGPGILRVGNKMSANVR